MPGLLRGIARTALVAGTATALANRVTRRQAERWAPPPPPPTPPTVSTVSTVDDEALLERLSELGELKSRGLLTEEEFTLAKSRLLRPEAPG